MALKSLKRALRIVLSEKQITALKAFIKRYAPAKRAQEVDALYRLLYNAVHDNDESLDLTARQTVEAFSNQWENLPEGQFMLSDPWFKENIRSILAEQMLLLKPEWFKDRRVLDAGCGNGRWSFALASMGSKITCVDINEAAIEKTKNALASFGGDKRFIKTPMEALHTALPHEKFDLVYSFGVLHHCKKFNQSFENVVDKVADGGVLFLYLYGRESMTLKEDLDIFKDRVQYNALTTGEEREKFLVQRVGGHREYLHQMHDLLAPLINRRLEFVDISTRLKARGFTGIERTVESTDLFIRAFKGDVIPAETLRARLPMQSPPYWFEHHK
jgi:2-polyprenyl-3-methyl-5-hydroxy-6-metoxy-1,4-benzoquinol methylase